MGGVCTYRGVVEETVSSRRGRAGLPKLPSTFLALSLMALTLGACQMPDQTPGRSMASASAAGMSSVNRPPSLNPGVKSWTPGNLAALGKNGSMIGVADRDLSAALGEPTQVRRDDPAEIWQYRGQECVLDFYLYRASAGLQVTYVEARDRHAQAEGTDQCVKSMMQPTTAALSKTNVQKTADAGE